MENEKTMSAEQAAIASDHRIASCRVVGGVVIDIVWKRGMRPADEALAEIVAKCEGPAQREPQLVAA